jgi:hypothetical protein
MHKVDNFLKVVNFGTMIMIMLKAHTIDRTFQKYIFKQHFALRVKNQVAR